MNGQSGMLYLGPVVANIGFLSEQECLILSHGRKPYGRNQKNAKSRT
jgi:hypothetical protein